MLILLDTGPAQPLAQCERELGMPVGQLLTPLTRYRIQDRSRPYAIDNGAFSSFDEGAFLSLLAREFEYREDCLFVSAPDVVGDAIATRKLFDAWLPRLAGWPVALVLQDGQDRAPPIPWDDIAAVFIGGTNRFKLSAHALELAAEAKERGKWVHMGRVNSPSRLHSAIFAEVDSVDGTGISRYTHMRTALRDSFNQERMFA